MKNFLLLSISLGIFAVSCGTKEPRTPSNSTDSTVVDNTVQPVPSAPTDTMTTKMTHPDSIKMKMDTVTAPATR